MALTTVRQGGETVNAFKHIRLGFSLMLMPAFLLSVAMIGSITGQTLALFIILHLFIYPASNGYNTYFDRDKKAIGGLAHPPPVNRTLAALVTILDVIGLLASVVFLPRLVPGILAYQIASRLYSYHRVRIKSLPWLSFAMVGAFQGTLIYIMVCYTVSPNASINAIALLAIFIYLIASYPITQSYQIEEDLARGDRTVASSLGVGGSILLTACLFPAYLLAGWHASLPRFEWLIASTTPVLITFAWISFWYFKQTEISYKSIRTLILLNWAAIVGYFVYCLQSGAIRITL